MLLQISTRNLHIIWKRVLFSISIFQYIYLSNQTLYLKIKIIFWKLLKIYFFTIARRIRHKGIFFEGLWWSVNVNKCILHTTIGYTYELISPWNNNSRLHLVIMRIRVAKSTNICRAIRRAFLYALVMERGYYSRRSSHEGCTVSNG